MPGINATAHVRRYHRHYGSSGHVWQGRFKAFPIEEDDHLFSGSFEVVLQLDEFGLIGDEFFLLFRFQQRLFIDFSVLGEALAVGLSFCQFIFSGRFFLRRGN
jgi:hypothetical protein